MSPSYQNWTVSGYLRPEMDFTRDGKKFKTGGQEQVAVIFDPRGWRWDVTVKRIDGRARVTSLLIQGNPEREIDQRAMRQVPLSDLAVVAATYWREVDRRHNVGGRIDEALELVSTDEGQTRLPGDAPSLQEFAAAWRETEPSKYPGQRPDVPRRQALAKRYGVSVHSIDKWTRAARDADPPLIDPKKVGRPRDKQSQKRDKNDNTKK